MIYKMYSIYDLTDNGYTTPIPMLSEDLAKRYFKDQMLGNPTLTNTPEDFELYYMGTFDTASGTFVQDNNAIKRIAKGVDYIG